MSDLNESSPENPTALWAQSKPFVERFEKAWRRGPRPALDEHLPSEPALRRVVLVELIRVDLECRLEAGEPARVEAYLQLYPELSEKPNVAAQLILAEYRLRRLKEPALQKDEYLARFPTLAIYFQGWTDDSRLQPGCSTLPRSEGAEQGTVALETVTLPGAVPASKAAALPPSRYLPIQLHAKGNLGEVLLAQDPDLNRTVALKRIQERHADNADSQRRFLREAEITGRLDHPGIVPVHGLGKDAEGRPCYAMRFIQGESLKDAIHRFHAADKPGRDASERRLALRELLTSFVTVCKTMAYAHSRGVLHRDLKPANIMLGKYGETLVVDWGLAKTFERDEAARLQGEESLQPGLAGDGSKTQTGAIFGTPAFASPEQIAGQWAVVGPASDIFSLGATLYNLLTNCLPYQGSNVHEIVAQSSQGEVIPPRQRKKDVPRALEAICLKAMAKQREQRYRTALELAAEVEHWLADESVSVYREPWLQRLGRWARRHRGLAASSVVGVAVAAVSLLVVSLMMGRKNAELEAANTREHAAADLARQTIEDMTSEDALRFLETQKELRPEQRHFLEQAVAYYREAVGEDVAGEEGQAQHGRAYFRMGSLQQRLGLNTEAEATFRAALDKYERLVAMSPQKPTYRQELARSHKSLGNLLATLGKRPEAEKEYGAALAEYEGLAAEHSQMPAYQQELARSRINMGLLLADLGKQAEAEKQYRAALAELARLVAEHPQVPEYLENLAACHGNLGILLRAEGKRSEGEKELRESLAENQRLTTNHPHVAVYQQELARNHINLGNLLMDLGKWPEAEKEYGAALAEFELLAVAHPQVPLHRQELARGHHNLGNLLKRVGRQPEAEKQLRAAVAEFEGLAVAHPQVPAYRLELAGSHNGLRTLLAALRKVPEAEKEYRAALAELAGLVAEHPRAPAYRWELAASHLNLGELLALEKSPEAEKEYRAAVIEYERLTAEHPQVPAYAVELAVSYGSFGNLLNDRRQPVDAIAWFAKAINTLEGAMSKLGGEVTGREFLRESYRGRAQALAKLGRYSEAIGDWDRALDLDDGSAGPSIRAGRAKTLVEAGEVVRASAAAEELLKTGTLNGDVLYDIACLFSLANAKAKEPAQAERYAGRAVSVLREAVAKGYANLQHMKKDTGLDPLRQRDDFKKLVADLEAKQKAK
jgi:serine/threonine-protein kinase